MICFRKEGAVIALVSAFGWANIAAAQTMVDQTVCRDADICLLQLPSGFQFLALLAGRAPAAAGICAASATYLIVWMGFPIAAALTKAALLTFVPLLLIGAASRWLLIRNDLSNLVHIHLPLLAVAAALGLQLGSLLHMLADGAARTLHDTAYRTLHLATESFAGILLTVALVFGGVRILRMARVDG